MYISKFLQVLWMAGKWLSALLVALILVWFVLNRLLDEEPHPSRSHILSKLINQVPESRNVAVGILGLTAPSGTDFIQFGISIKRLRAEDVPWAKTQDLLYGPSSLQITVDSTHLTCWISPDDPVFKECLPFDQAPSAIERNKELLDRFRSLYNLDELFNESGGYYNKAYIDLAKLSVADMQLDIARRNYSTAYLKWRDQMSFIRRTLRGTDDLVGKAMGSVTFGITYGVLEDLLVGDPSLAKQHRNEILNVLRPNGISDINPEGMAYVEFRHLVDAIGRPGLTRLSDYPVFDWLFQRLSQKNRTLNRYAKYTRDYAQAIQLSWPETEAALNLLEQKYVSDIDSWDFAIDPFGSIFLATHISGHLRSREFIRQMHLIDGRLRLASLLVQLVSADVPDGDVDKFLASTNSELKDGFSGTPMKWDAKNRRIYFADPKDKCAIYYARIPQRAGSKLPPPQRSPWQIC